MKRFILVASFLLSLSLSGWAQSGYDKEIKALLKRMSLEEKVGQMTQIDISRIVDRQTLGQWNRTDRYVIDDAKLKRYIDTFHVGSFLGGYAISSESWYPFQKALQEYNLGKHPNKIPIIYGIDHIHGATYVKGSTVFPQSFTLAGSFNPDLARKMGEVTVYESAHLGHHWVFNPVLGLARNKFWGRMHETFGEDPYLASRMGEAYVRGIQEGEHFAETKVAACAKHFLGYSVPKTGRDRSSAEIAPQVLQEMLRPSFQAAIDAGAKTLMINSGDINGEPVHASYDILTKLLREDMGFTGVAVTDWEDIILLHKGHKVAATPKEAVYMAIQAGVDMSMVPYETSFCTLLTELVKEGRISEDRIDQSVRRILALKYDLGIFDHPLPKHENHTGKAEHIALAKQAVEESIVLVKNQGNVLPLAKEAKIVVAGSTKNMKRSLTGGWTYLWQHMDDDAFPADMPTVEEALIKEMGAKQVVVSSLEGLRAQASDADAILIVSGEATAYGEGMNNTLDLDLIPSDMALLEEATLMGKPVVLILTEGRPRTFPKVVDAIDAIVFAGLPGPYGAEGIVDILTGAVNPSGKMSFTYPYHQSFQLPYNHKPSDMTYMHYTDPNALRYSIADFGHGLSYSAFAYTALKLDKNTLSGKADKITATVTVKNTSDRDGKESVLWFIRDEYGKIIRPVKALKHFEKAMISAGTSQSFSFEIDPMRDLAYPDASGNMILESGDFTLMVGDQEVAFTLE